MKKDPAEAPLSTATTAKPFLTLALIFLYEISNDSSILDSKSEDFFIRSFSSFSVSFKISPSSFFLCFKCSFLSFNLTLFSSIDCFF